MMAFSLVIGLHFPVRFAMDSINPIHPRHSGMRHPNSGLPEFGKNNVQVGNSRLGWRRPGIHNHDREYGSGLAAEPVIGPRFARTRWHAPEDQDGAGLEHRKRPAAVGWR